MTRFQKLRARLSRFPVLVALVVLGTAGLAAQQYLADDCCYPGAPCCHPGAPCCAHHKANG